MHILRQLATAILPVALLIPGIANAEVITPALDIALFGEDSGADLTYAADGKTPDKFNIDATAFAIVTDVIGTSTNIPNQSFTLSGTFDTTTSLFVGIFDVAGGLLTGEFTDLLVTQTSATSPFSFEANLTYLSGSLMGGLTGGRLEGVGDTSNLAAKLGAVVPVPAAVWLFGSGLIGLIGVARRKA